MATVVPFDNTELSIAALSRATEIPEFAENLRAVTVIPNKLRRYAKDAGAETVVIGSDNAGRVVSTLGSIGRTVATDTAYDVFIVRSATSPER